MHNWLRTNASSNVNPTLAVPSEARGWHCIVRYMVPCMHVNIYSCKQCLRPVVAFAVSSGSAWYSWRLLLLRTSHCPPRSASTCKNAYNIACCERCVAIHAQCMAHPLIEWTRQDKASVYTILRSCCEACSSHQVQAHHPYVYGICNTCSVTHSHSPNAGRCLPRCCSPWQTCHHSSAYQQR
jgi:hypothetical protein